MKYSTAPNTVEAHTIVSVSDRDTLGAIELILDNGSTIATDDSADPKPGDYLVADENSFVKIIAKSVFEQTHIPCDAPEDSTAAQSEPNHSDTDPEPSTATDSQTAVDGTAGQQA